MFVVLVTVFASLYIAMQNSWVQTKITQKVARKLSKRLNTEISVGKVEIRLFKNLYLEDVLIKDQNKDTLLFSNVIKAKIDTLKFKTKRISIHQLSFENAKLHTIRDSLNTFNFEFLLQAISNKSAQDTLNMWDISCQNFGFSNTDINYSSHLSKNYSSINIKNSKLEISDFHSFSDSLSFRINNFSTYNGNGLQLKDMTTLVEISRKHIKLHDLSARSTYSSISNTELDVSLSQEIESTEVPFDIRVRLGTSKISFRELGELSPTFKGMTQSVELSGLIYGNLNDLKGKGLVLKTEKETQASFDFYINDVTNPENMYLFLDMKELQTSFQDIGNFRLPHTSKRSFVYIPDHFYDAGLIKFHGNFSGFLSDFVTFGTLESEMGTLATDILVIPEKEGQIHYRGNISTSNFMLGKLFKQNKIGAITFNGTADGNYNEEDHSVSGIFKGKINKIDINKYIFKDIHFDGILNERMFDGLMSINDPNLQFRFLGELDLNDNIPHFDFNLNVKKAHLSNLNLGTSFPKAEVAFNMTANFEGDKIDNLDGKIIFEEGFYKNRNGEFKLNGMELASFYKDGLRSMVFTSDFFDATIKGDYDFRSLSNDFHKIIQHYIPTVDTKTSLRGISNDFKYSVHLKELNTLTEVFIPDLQFETPFLLHGILDTPNNYFSFKGNIPGIRYKDFWARNIYINNQDLNNSFSSKFKVNEVWHRNGMKLYNFNINTSLGDDVMNNTISWSNYDEITYSGLLRTETKFSGADSSASHHIQVNGLPSYIYIADTLWSIAPFSAGLNSNTVEFSEITITHGIQQIKANGKLVKGKTDGINLELQNIDLSHIDKYLNKNMELQGIANGAFSVTNIFNEPLIISNLSIDEFSYKKQAIGDISLQSQWNRIYSGIDSELKITRDNHVSFKTFGFFKPSTGELQYRAEADSLPLIILGAFMRKNFSDFRGHGTGEVHIGGSLKKISLNGAVFAENAGLKIDATQIPYTFNDSVYFRNDTIAFDNITLFDDRNNPGSFDGTIVHENFKNMTFDLNFGAEKIRAMNTTTRDNEQFYGTIVANGNLEITGRTKDTKLLASVTSLRGTDIRISMESENTVEQYDFIEFVKAEQEEKTSFFEEEVAEKKGNLNMTFNIEATPEAKVQIIYNSQIGDVLKAQGEGILLFEMDNKGNMSLSGNFNPTKGDYLFTLQNVINKRFTIAQGGSMIWSGDPYNADIDISAIYKLKASLYDLFSEEFEIKSQKQRIPVECIIQLEDKLQNPSIGFDVNFPITDEDTKDRLSQFFKTDEEMNKQILSLIIMGKFYTPDYLRGSYNPQNSNMVGTTASELLSNQLSNWLSQISSNWDIGLNYRPETEISDEEIELALSTQIFNDRVSLNGNIANNANNYSNSNSQIVGDFEIGVKLVPSGKIQFKAYNRSNNNIIYDTAPYTQGIGLSFKEEYNTFEELLEKLKNMFKKKSK